MPDRRIGIALLCALLLAACGGQRVQDGPPSGGIGRVPDDPVPRPEPLSRYGNGPEYEVLGRRYTVMASASGYNERGVASWYGSKFHGRLTSSREPYDMYAMTAAHKTLPLPTWVRVRNLRNGRSVVVRVNDRGPFVHNRIIDLSYAAAVKLDMVADGTSLVEVTAISFDGGDGDFPAATANPGAAPPAVEQEPAAATIFAQVGAFGDVDNASRRHALLVASGVDNAFVVEDRSVNPPLYRVRIGPIADVFEYDVLVQELEKLGISDPYLVTE